MGKKEREIAVIKILSYVERHAKGISGGLAGTLQNKDKTENFVRNKSMKCINEHIEICIYVTILVKSCGAYVGVGSRLELLDSSGGANVLNLVTKGSFVHGITTTRLLAGF